MSGPGAVSGGQPTTSAAPGWYPDPDGAPGLVRWFDGAAWSDVTTPAGPGVALAGDQHAWTPPQHPGWEQAPPASRSRRVPVVVGLSVLGLVLAVVLAVVLSGSGGTGPSPGAPGSVAPQAAPGTPFPPGTVRITDSDAGISYPFLGNGWYEYDLGRQRETVTTAGQFFTTQDLTPDGTSFIAQCTSGGLQDGYGWTGPGSLAATMPQVADSVRLNYYPMPNDRRVLRDEALTVDGAPAQLFEFELSWDVEGYDATGERAALLLVDVGRPAPALLYISIPNTHAELYGVIDRVVDAVEVV
ncbi:DUF2510 domain-containing protein [Modestobacter sp. I12A-02628]|uniref:DUF2510 domain-containing protein n=1 Tax=Goekera deserti TaxID=2497753 RepID=A0A7K3W801_9ACTN|nr:DUF2510 domain-containing protein [Goekera deserti]MPQ99848.1 DUF2510 domain-containing protein [Goekera deserti]NDI50006.1 DUF2510 domain-containing protein [Goekera deserti]NEL52517.1 DUF2510 domain-containing protein [Goekera deserti]